MAGDKTEVLPPHSRKQDYNHDCAILSLKTSRSPCQVNDALLYSAKVAPSLGICATRGCGWGDKELCKCCNASPCSPQNRGSLNFLPVGILFGKHTIFCNHVGANIGFKTILIFSDSIP